MRLRIRNWAKFQHYKFRKPPWIKLYREILDDPDWHNLSGESAKGLIMLWLLASEDDGYLPDSITLAFRLRVSENRAIALLSDCSKWFETDASSVLATCYQDAIPETETETEKSRVKPTAHFGVFWENYPRKVGKAKATALWRKLKPEEELLAIRSVSLWMQTEQWRREDGKYIPYASTFLAQRRWADEPWTGAFSEQ